MAIVTELEAAIIGQTAQSLLHWRDKALALDAALAALIADTAHFAQRHHQGHHGDVAGTYATCDRGLCPGVVRSLARARAARGDETTWEN